MMEETRQAKVKMRQRFLDEAIADGNPRVFGPDGAYFDGSLIWFGLRCLEPKARWASIREFYRRRSPLNRDETVVGLERRHNPTHVRETLLLVNRTRFFAVNFPAERLRSIWLDGRLKSCWETGESRMDISKGHRDWLERRMLIRAMGGSSDPHPIYGAVGFANGRDEKLGPAPHYGQCHLRLKEESIKSRVVFLYGDLGDVHLGEHAKRMFDIEHVDVARAKVELDGDTDYVELQVFGGVSLDDVEEVCVPAGSFSEETLRELRESRTGVAIREV